ncbi:hypothetical protein FIBSPDRAFT_959834 [Athelia psychrophila]|uniref:Uncharacterized protein n=1 Tax=Athelia psychrophila TaxID=1759441 RepID=A0A166D2J4_9AGAM|nr:hypothetical protein FIBSPDRAFT_959834 [Fibularhizoctonia sp. CBS 109695]
MILKHPTLMLQNVLALLMPSHNARNLKVAESKTKDLPPELKTSYQELSAASGERHGHQPENMDTQTMSAKREHNEQLNLKAPMSIIPNEALSMIFEAGIGFERESKSYYEEISQ